jgi:large subunit ribosomal protein L29
MKFTEMKDWTVEELRKKNAELRDGLFQLRMKNALGQLSNPLEVRHVRRDLARIKTALNQKLAQ